MRSNLNADESSAAITSSAPLNRFQALRQLLLSPDLSFLMEAHNGLSAKIVEEAGFQGIWASGLSISASLGVRDNNEASWTQFLEVLEFMADATLIPMLVDGDTGFGNFNNVRRLVRKLCDRGVAGVCIEDKLFPKTNSFIGDHQPLADREEFCGRIKAGKDSQTDDDEDLADPAGFQNGKMPFQQAPAPEFQQDLRGGVLPVAHAPASASGENDGYHD